MTAVKKAEDLAGDTGKEQATDRAMQYSGERIGKVSMSRISDARPGATTGAQAGVRTGVKAGAAMARPARLALMLGTALALAACGGMPTDWDLRGERSFSTANAAREASPSRPSPDERGVITYERYQVVVARRGDTPRAIASRLGVDGDALARHNAIDPETSLRGGETLVLPDTDTRPDDERGGPLSAPGITETRLDAAPEAGSDPIRHEVERGETVFSIARLYNVTARSIADWNGLGSDMSVREGQILMVPRPQSISDAADTRTAARGDRDSDADDRARRQEAQEEIAAVRPGAGTQTPTPPSASRPMPDSTEPASTPEAEPEPEREPVADMASQRTEGPRLAMPVEGRIVRAYQRGRNDGIGIGAPAGTAVRAAASGTVAAITRDTDQVPIMVVRHQDNLLTVYANIDDIRVERGDRVSSGDTIATVRRGDPSYLHFEVREGLESVDPMPYLQ